MSWAGSATRFDTAEGRLFCSGCSPSRPRPERKLTWTKPSLTLTTAKHNNVSNTR